MYAETHSNTLFHMEINSYDLSHRKAFTVLRKETHSFTENHTYTYISHVNSFSYIKHIWKISITSKDSQIISYHFHLETHLQLLLVTQYYVETTSPISSPSLIIKRSLQ